MPAKSQHAHNPHPGEILLAEFWETEHEHFAGHLDEAEQYVTTGESPAAEGLDAADHAALTALVQALMNFDECVTKR